MKYTEYIISREWMLMRGWRLIIDKYKCQRCGRKRELEVHHITYERLGRERDEDLVTVCVRCHNDIHYASEQIEGVQLLKQLSITQEEYERNRQKDALGVK